MLDFPCRNSSNCLYGNNDFSMSQKSSALLSLDAARQILADSATRLDPVRTTLGQAHGLVLAETVHSDIDLPHWNVSAMDGYAVRAQDLAGNTSLPVVFEVRAGDDPAPLPPGSAARIFTGAVIPPGADTVIPQELAQPQPPNRVLLDSLPVGSYVRPKGAVLARGAKIAEAGDRLTPGRIALLAAGGAAQVDVIPPPRVTVVMTGSELVEPGRQPKPGAVRDSNGPMLRALIEMAPFTFVRNLSCPDDLDRTCRVLEQASAEADLVVTSGGVSVGDFDFVPEAVRKLGGTVLFHRLSIKPGKPVLAARLGQTWLLGLPGNPVSVLTCWRLFALPLGKALAGDISLLQEKPRRAVIAAALKNDENRTLLHPAILDQAEVSTRITPLPWKGSHDIASAAGATALIRLEAGGAVKSGDEVGYYRLNNDG